MNEVWLVTANCGDYYCGCGQGHVVGCATTEERARSLMKELSKRDRLGNPAHPIAGKQMNYGPFSTMEVYGPVVVNAPNEHEFQSGFR